MLLVFLPISYFLKNGMTADDLGLLLVGATVILLMIGLSCRAVVTNLPSAPLPIGF